MDNVCCMSVAGGWQSFNSDTQEYFGPVFNRINDLWAWQRSNYGLTVIRPAAVYSTINV